MTAVVQPPTHRVSRFARAAHTRLDELVEVPLWSMDATEAAETLVALDRLQSRLVELKARVARQADQVGVAEEVAASSIAAWLAHQTKQTRRDARREMRLAEALDARPQVRQGLAAGAVNVEQAHVLTRALDELPDSLAPDLAAEAEAVLVGYAGEHDAKALKILGRRVLDAVAPEVAEAHEAALLDREEHEAAASTRLVMVDDRHGCTRGRFTIPTAQAGMLRKALTAIAAPKHQAANGVPKPQERRPSAERLGQALCEYVERYPADRVPNAGGVNATVVVTMELDTLLGGLRAAGLDTGERTSPGQARRLACEAGIIPAVLGGDSQPLDLGRQSRMYKKYQRIAMGLRDKGCTSQGCDVPPGGCHAHHDTPWSEGGRTDLTCGRLLCPHHHTRAHDPAYEMRRHPDGTVTFHRRA